LLKGVMREDGGWGYNKICLSDSDSTSYSILFLNECREIVPSKCFQRLLEFQSPDGGFSTYDRKYGINSWRVSHPDVSPVALRALLIRLTIDNPVIQSGITYILSQLNSNGLWNSFWWTTSLYSTLANILLLEQTHTPYNKNLVLNATGSLPIPTDPFQIALLGEILAVLDANSSRTLEIGYALSNLQHEDGSWHASIPNLRLTDIHCYVPWDNNDNIEAIFDHHHFFTTATAIRFLTKIKSKPSDN